MHWGVAGGVAGGAAVVSTGTGPAVVGTRFGVVPGVPGACVTVGAAAAGAEVVVVDAPTAVVEVVVVDSLGEARTTWIGSGSPD